VLNKSMKSSPVETAVAALFHCPRSAKFAFTLTLLCLAFTSIPSMAQVTWNGSGPDSNWSTGLNWAGGSPPSGGNALAFAGTTRLTNVNDLSADTSFSGITFNGGAGAFSLSGNRITLGGNVTNSSANRQTMNFDILLSGVRTFSGTSVTLGGSVSGTGGITLNAPTTTLMILSGNNSYSGNTTLTAGSIALEHSNALGTSTVSQTTPSATDTKLQLRNNITVTNSVILGGGGLLSNSIPAGSLENLSGDNTLTNFTFASSGGTRVALTGGSLTISNNITDLSGIAVAHRFLGNGTLVLSGNNTGAFKVGAGANTFFGLSGVGGATIAVGNDLALGAAPIVLEANTTFRSASAADRTLANGWTANSTASTVTFGSAGTGNLTLTGTVALGGNTQIVVNNARTTISNTISQTAAAALTKNGSGTLELTGSNTFAGGVNVNAGTLLINNTTGNGTGSGAVSVSTGAVLGGNGSFSAAASINGTLSPGNSIGTISTGNLTLTSSSTLSVELGRSGITPVADRVAVTGSVNLDNNLELTLFSGLNNPLMGDIFFLISNDGVDAISGTFNKLNGVTTTLTEGSVFAWNAQSWQITYQANFEGTSFTGGNDLAVQAIPEPGTWAMILCAGVLLVVFSRRVSRRLPA